MQPRSTTETIIGALRILARDIQSDDGVANAAIWEAAARMQELHRANVDSVRWYNELKVENERLKAQLNEFKRNCPSPLVRAVMGGE